MSTSRSKPMRRSPHSVTLRVGSSDSGCTTPTPPAQDHERLTGAEQGQGGDELRQPGGVAEEREHAEGHEAEQHPQDEAAGDRDRGRDIVPDVVAVVGGDAAHGAGAEVQDARRPVDEDDGEGDERGQGTRGKAEQHEPQRGLAEQRRRQDHHAPPARAVRPASEVTSPRAVCRNIVAAGTGGRRHPQRSPQWAARGRPSGPPSRRFARPGARLPAHAGHGPHPPAAHSASPGAGRDGERGRAPARVGGVEQGALGTLGTVTRTPDATLEEIEAIRARLMRRLPSTSCASTGRRSRRSWPTP